MRRLALALAASLVISLSPCVAQPSSTPSRFDFASIGVGQVVQPIYAEALSSPFVLDPAVISDGRLVSFRYSTEKGDLKAFMRSFLGSLGYSIEHKDGVDFIAKPKQPEVVAPEQEPFVYLPRFRSVAYLSKLLSPLFKGSFTVNRGVQAGEPKTDGAVVDGSAASLLDQNSDALIFLGDPKEVERLGKLLPQVDTAVGEVAVRGVVYEVSNADKSGSAFGLLASVLGGRLNVGVGTATSIGNFIQFKQASLDLIYSALSNDSRFRVVSSPSLRIRSGSNGRFSVGQDVPVLGSVSYPNGAGQAVQSVEYRSSGVIFEVQPVVRDGVIELNIDQQLSNFVVTTTGVNSSPTLTKRALKTSVGLQDGDVIVLGGLTENRESHARDGLSFLPRMLDTTGADTSKSEILLVLQVHKL